MKEKRTEVTTTGSWTMSVETRNETSSMSYLYPSNSTTYELYEDDSAPFYDFVHAMYIYVIPLVSILGIIGNVLSFRVFMFTTFNKQPSSIYLSLLSTSDTCFLLALLVGWFGSLDTLFTQTGSLCMISVYITYVTSFLSVWYVVLIMLDRYIVVCHPLRGPRLCSRKRVTIASIVITTFGILFYTHCFFTTEVVAKPHDEGIQCAIQREAIAVIAIITYIDSAITFIIPFVAVFILNFSLIFAIRKFNKKHVKFYNRRYHSPQYSILTRAQIRLTVMLVVVSSVFLVLNLPSHGVRFYILLNELASIRNDSLSLFLIQQLFQILYYINFAINFILYLSSSKLFRRCLTETTKCYINTGRSLISNREKT